MDEVNVISLAVGGCVDAVSLLFDLLARMFSCMLHLLSCAGSSLSGAMAALSGSTLVEYSNFALFSFLTATEAVSSAAHGALQTAEGWLQTLGGVLETFKMVGHLTCHLVWRTKDVLHRSLISGSCILRQTWEGICIALSLILYLVNTVVNIVLISMQNSLSVLAGVWESVADPVHKVAELALTLLTFVYSCLIGASALLWTPCQLVLDFLGALGRVIIAVFVADSHGLLIAATMASLGLLLLNPRLSVLARWLGLNLVHVLQMTIRRLNAVVEPALAHQGVHNETAGEVGRTRLLNTDTSDLISPTEADLLPRHEQSPSDSTQTGDSAVVRRDSRGTHPSPPSSAPHEVIREDRSRTLSTRLSLAVQDGELLSLLKEQEERKKCVICQDLSKTVLLLPCRHLCLCRPCADILTQRRPVQQHCCPLCRQPITQTMDVFL